MTSRGTELEKLVRDSTKRFEDAGLWIKQVGPRFVPFGPPDDRGAVTGRIIEKGALDFVGVYQGRMLSFDAKSTREALRFDLDNIEPHQAKLAGKLHDRGAIAFFLLELAAGTPLNRYFALPWPVLAPRWKGWVNSAGGPSWVKKWPASIPLAVLEADCLEVQLVKRSKDLNLLALVEALLRRIAPKEPTP